MKTDTLTLAGSTEKNTKAKKKKEKENTIGQHQTSNIKSRKVAKNQKERGENIISVG